MNSATSTARRPVTVESTQRVTYIIGKPDLIRNFLTQVQKEKTEIRAVLGLVEYTGRVSENTRDSFTAVFKALDSSLLPDPGSERNRLSVRIEYKRYFFSFDCVVRSVSRLKNPRRGEDEQVYVLENPDEMRRNTDRALRVRPMDAASLSIPQYSMTNLRHETDTFHNFENKMPILQSIDRNILKADEWSLGDARAKIEEELRSLAGMTTGKPGPGLYRFVTRATDERKTLDKINELWILDTQKSSISIEEKGHYAEKGIGSLVVSIVKNQFLQRDAFLLITRASGKLGFTQPEQAYIRALARRMVLTTQPNLRMTFPLRDIGEDGLSFTDPEGHLAVAKPGTILRDLVLAVNKISETNLSAAIVRSAADVRAVRTDYPEFASRLKIRDFIESTLRLKKLTGKIY